MSSGAQAVAGVLSRAGIDTVFGLPGAHNLALWPALAAVGIRVVGVRHEQTCAYAADGAARSTGKVAVALTTTGPGAANTIAAVGEAWASRSPVVVIATDIPSGLRREGTYRGVLHECVDQEALFAPVTKARMTAATAGDVAATVAAALAAAAAPPQRPVYVGIPSDLLTADVGEAGVGMVESPDQSVDYEEVAAAVDVLAGARRPVLWVGGGGRAASREIAALAEALGAPVVTTYQARGLLPPTHRLAVTAPPHEPRVTDLLREADAVVVVGSDLDQMTTQGWRLPLPDRRVAINLDPTDATKNYPMDVVVHADAAAACCRLVEGLGDGPLECWAGDLHRLDAEVRRGVDPQALELLEATEAVLRDRKEVVTFCDMAVAGYWLAGYMEVARERGLHYPMGWGTLGWAFPAAIGAAAMGRRSLAVCGDGGMLFAVGELATAAQEGLALTVVVADDGGYGMLRHSAGPAGPEAGGCELAAPDFAAVADAFGVRSFAVEGLGADYAAAVGAAVDSAAPALVHAKARLHPPPTTTPYWPLRDQPAFNPSNRR